MAPSLASYIAGTLQIAAVVGATWYGSWWLRRWIVPEFSGALARLAELTIGFALITISLELVGSVGLLKPAWITASCILIALIGAGLAWKFAPRDIKQIEAPAVSKWAFLVAVGVASWVVAEWSFPTQLSLDQGMFGGDTTWYHMPAAARFIQDASIIHLHFTDALRLAVWFYPQNSELMHGALMGLMDSDWLSPVFNMLPLGIGLLACWCVGRPYAVAPATLVAGAILLSGGVMIETQPGEGRNDIVCFAFLVAFIAFLINGHQRHAPKAGAVDEKPDPDAPLLDKGPLILAGIAAGLAISMKVSMLAPVGVILIGMILISGRKRWLTTTLCLGIPMLLVGGYWYVRAMIYTGGNPVPAIGWGPLHLPQPDQMPLDPRPRFSVAHYLGEPSMYRWWFFPRLDDAFGVLFPLILTMLAAASTWLVVKSRNKIVRVISAAAIITAVVYVFTPLTAAGQEFQPRGFFTNTRYLLPGLLLAAMMLPLIRQLREPEERARKVLIFLTGIFVITVLTSPKWYPSYIFGTIFLTLAIVWAPVGLSWLKDHTTVPRYVIVGCVAAIAIIAAIWGRGEQVGYAEKHYTRTTLFLQEGGPQDSFAFAHAMKNKRLAVAGSGQMFFGQYGFYGLDRSNYVQYIGEEGDIGTYRLITRCRPFIEKVNEGDYDYIFVSEYTQDAPEADYRYPVRAWIDGDPAAELVIAEEDITPQPAFVYRLNGRLDPDRCEELDRRNLDPARTEALRKQAEEEAEEAAEAAAEEAAANSEEESGDSE